MSLTGALRLLSTDKIENPTVLGLFGENESGKTTLLRALTLLQPLLTEKPLDDARKNFIRVDSETAQLQVEFLGYPDVGHLPSVRVFYEAALQRKKVVEGWIESLGTAEKNRRSGNSIGKAVDVTVGRQGENDGLDAGTQG